MAEKLSFEDAGKIADEAREAYGKAKTKAQVEEVIKTYGKKIGYKPVIRVTMLGWDNDKALKVYKAGG